MPVELEKRAMTGVTLLKCGAVDRAAASDEGEKLPVTSLPRACAGRYPAGVPNALFSVCARLSAVFTRASSFGIGMFVDKPNQYSDPPLYLVAVFKEVTVYKL